MAHLKVGKENSADIELYYEDRGEGQPVVLVHGWPLNGASWERQATALLAAGYRVITYDRRGFGHSSKPYTGYDYDTLARDLSTLLDSLDLQNVALFGFSMGGGEVARYMGKYNSGRVTKCGFLSSIAPALRKDGANPDGVDPSVFEGIKGMIEKDRFDQLQGFAKLFYNYGVLSHSVSQAKLDADFIVASQSSYQAMLFCVDAWLEDFRDDIKQIQVPTLVIHGDSDKIVPLENSGARIPGLVPSAKLHVIKDGPHGLIWTHAAEVNTALLEFLHA
ncbi:MAG TPA: alpha/beta hydrolase [Acidobacteriaceae bacterium]|nr:alpha/beta hydrolase [Acidobacteriaceae bacterium]